jgi:hypothetical protein
MLGDGKEEQANVEAVISGKASKPNSLFMCIQRVG